MAMHPDDLRTLVPFRTPKEIRAVAEAIGMVIDGQPGRAGSPRPACKRPTKTDNRRRTP